VGVGGGNGGRLKFQWDVAKRRNKNEGLLVRVQKLIIKNNQVPDARNEIPGRFVTRPKENERKCSTSTSIT